MAQDLGDVGELAGVGVQGLAGELVAQAVGGHAGNGQVAADAGEPAAGPRPGPTSGSCDAAGSNSTAYTSGNEVSCNGHNWTASQWNYDEVPGGASGAWNDDGAADRP